MSFEDFNQNIKNKIEKGDTKEAINLMLEFLKENDSIRLDNARLIKSRWIKLERSKMQNLITNDFYSIELSKIDHDILKFLDHDESQSIAKEFDWGKVKKYGIITLLLVAIVSIVTLFVEYYNEKQRNEIYIGLIDHEDQKVRSQISLINDQIQNIERDTSITNDVSLALSETKQKVDGLNQEYQELREQVSDAVEDGDMIMGHVKMQEIRKLDDKYHLTDKNYLAQFDSLKPKAIFELNESVSQLGVLLNNNSLGTDSSHWDLGNEAIYLKPQSKFPIDSISGLRKEAKDSVITVTDSIGF